MEQFLSYIHDNGAGSVALALFFWLYYKHQTEMTKSLSLLAQAVNNSTKVVERFSDSMDKHIKTANRIEEHVKTVEGDTQYIRDKVNQF